ncbi:MAG: hypothetical protein R6V10_02245 [bacterium]
MLERLSTTLLRVLFWKKLVDAGYPLHKTDLDPFELWLFALIKETDDERE